MTIWKRIETLNKRYDSDASPRKTIPIEAIFQIDPTLMQIYKFMENRLLETVDDSNVYKISKIMGMTFLSDEV